MPLKITNPDTDIDAWMGQELTTALMQVFMDQQITTERRFLWADSLQCFKLK